MCQLRLFFSAECIRRDMERAWPEWTAAEIALVYLIIGGAWIAFTDRIVEILVKGQSLTTQIQTFKGWAFVAVSGLVIYGLTSRSREQLQRTNGKLKQTLRQSTVLHRVLRHNLRNSCDVIANNAELLRNGDNDESVERIHRQTDRLMNIAEKSHQLRDILLEDTCGIVGVDVAEMLRERADRAEAANDVDVTVTVPESLTVYSYPKLDTVIDELIENAIRHSDRDVPKLWIEAEKADRKWARIDIADDGPGMPEIERDVLAEGRERPLFHSQGVGLWIVHFIVTAVGGSLQIVDNEPRGTVVRLRLPRHSSVALAASPDSIEGQTTDI